MNPASAWALYTPGPCPTLGHVQNGCEQQLVVWCPESDG